MKIKRIVSATASVFLACAFLAANSAAQGRFFIRFGAGASDPSLESLDSELGSQGREKVDLGYTFAASLGRSFAEEKWSAELSFSTAFYRAFDYENEYERFTGKLRHYGYMVILRRHWRVEEKHFKPSLGIGIGYGLTNLVSGGGKLGEPEVSLSARIESSIAENISLALEGTYNAGLRTGVFAGPFLENVAGDAVLTSAGEPLEDKYNSIDVRLGITVWLRQMQGY